MIAKRIRRSERGPRGTIRGLHRFITALTQYVVDADAADLVEVETGRRLTDYILDATGLAALNTIGVETGEKVLHSGSRNLVGNQLKSWQAQMLAAAARAVRGRDPIEHYVLSWQTDEHPDERQFARAVDIAVDELGLSECQAVWAAHGNTKNLHVHIAVNRVHPVTGKMIGAGDYWDKDRLQQVCALIEHEGNWRAQENAEYAVVNGDVVHTRTGTVVRGRDGQQTRARDRANERDIVPDVFKPVVDAISQASSWLDLHDRLHGLGARYERAGPGANVIRGEARIKPSKLGRSCSLPSLTKRFGTYVRSPHLEGYPDFRSRQYAELDKLKSARASAVAAVERWYASQASGLTGNEASEIIALLLADLGARRTAIISAVEASFASAEAALSAIKSEKAWLAAGAPKSSTVNIPAIMLPPTSAHGQTRRGSSSSLDGLTRTVNASTGLSEYRHRTGEILLVDAGSVILVYKNDVAGLEAGLLLAARRWGEVEFAGDEDAAQIVTELAKTHGITVRGNDGQRLVPRAGVAVPASPTHRRMDESTGAARQSDDLRNAQPLDSIELPDENPSRTVDVAIAVERLQQSEPEPEGPDVIAYVHEQGPQKGR